MWNNILLKYDKPYKFLVFIYVNHPSDTEWCAFLISINVHVKIKNLVQCLAYAFLIDCIHTIFGRLTFGPLYHILFVSLFTVGAYKYNHSFDIKEHVITYVHVKRISCMYKQYQW